jgi:very-short-patch-repair endonuclease
MRDREHVDPVFRKVLRDRAREMRSKMSPPELKLWSRIRGDQIGGRRFRRQHPIGPFMADFFCSRYNLVIEVDGDSHFEPGREQDDRDRTRYFAGLGLREIRFTNLEVLRNIDGVVDAIGRAVGVA